MKIESSRPDNLSGKGLKIGIIFSRFNDSIGNKLLDNTTETLLSLGVEESDIIVEKVPGALEIPLVSRVLAKSKQYDALIALGVVMRGETYHFELVANESYRGIMKTMLKTKTPIIFGVITANNAEQAIARAEKDQLNKGKEYAESAVEMALLMKKLHTPKKDVE